MSSRSFYEGRRAPEITANASPTARPNASGIHTPKLSIEKTITCFSSASNITYWNITLSILDLLRKPFTS
jgi:hypothetical protein